MADNKSINSLNNSTSIVNTSVNLCYTRTFDRPFQFYSSHLYEFDLTCGCSRRVRTRCDWTDSAGNIKWKLVLDLWPNALLGMKSPVLCNPKSCNLISQLHQINVPKVNSSTKPNNKTEDANSAANWQYHVTFCWTTFFLKLPSMATYISVR
jgi:hypothetical protein